MNVVAVMLCTAGVGVAAAGYWNWRSAGARTMLLGAMLFLNGLANLTSTSDLFRMGCWVSLYILGAALLLRTPRSVWLSLKLELSLCVSTIIAIWASYLSAEIPLARMTFALVAAGLAATYILVTIVRARKWEQA